MLLARQAERRLCDFRLDQMLLQCGLMKEAKEMEQASQPAKEAEEAKEAPRPKRLRLGRPEDALWEGLYEQYGSPELRREFVPSPYAFRLPLLSAERKLELLIEDMHETLAFSSPDERARLHADWEWDLEAPSGDAFVMDTLAYLRPTSWGLRWNWEEQSKRRRARALSRLDNEFALRAEQSTEQYLADAQAFDDAPARGGGGGRGWVMVLLWRQGRPARRGPWTATPHAQPPFPIPHAQPPFPILPTFPFTLPETLHPFPAAWHDGGSARLVGRPGSRARWVRADPWPCTPAGPAGRAYKNTGLQTGLQPEQPTEAARSSSPVFSCSRFSARFIVQYC